MGHDRLMSPNAQRRAYWATDRVKTRWGEGLITILIPDRA
jgi:hypothetical protein